MPSITSAQQPPAGGAAPPAAAPATPPAAVSSSPSVAPNGRVFELRTYYCHPGRLEALNKRFREHTNALFVKHGMQLVGYWMPIDKPDVLVYVLAYPSREAAVKAWAAYAIASNEIANRHRVGLDETVQALAQTAKDMNSKYKETSEAGLALSVALVEC